MKSTQSKPDRELDAEIAEKVFGWQWSKHPTAELHYLRERRKPWYGAITELGNTSYTPKLPAYSSRIEDAWKLMERVRTMKPQQNFRFWWALRSHVAMRRKRSNLNETDASAVTHATPRDICLATLEALEIRRTLPAGYYDD